MDSSTDEIVRAAVEGNEDWLSRQPIEALQAADDALSVCRKNGCRCHDDRDARQLLDRVLYKAIELEGLAAENLIESGEFEL